MALFSRFIPCGVWEAVHLIEGLLANTSDIQPTAVHADTQGQSAPVFALATLFGFDLMPRIRNFKDLIFFRASEHLTDGCRELVHSGAGDDDRVASAVCLFRDPQEFTAVVFSKLHVKVLALNLEFLGLDDIIHS